MHRLFLFQLKQITTQTSKSKISDLGDYNTELMKCKCISEIIWNKVK